MVGSFLGLSWLIPCPLPIPHPQPDPPLGRDDADRVRSRSPSGEPPLLGREDAQRRGLPDGGLHGRAPYPRHRRDMADGQPAQAAPRDLGGDRRQDRRLGHRKTCRELRREPAGAGPAASTLHVSRGARTRAHGPPGDRRLRRDDLPGGDLLGELLRVLLGHRTAGKALPHGHRQLGKPVPWRALEGSPDVVREHIPCPILGPFRAQTISSVET